MAEPVLTPDVVSAVPVDSTAGWHSHWLRRLRPLLTLQLPRTVLSLLDQGIVSGTSFVTTVIVGRGASPAELGLFALAMTIVLFGRGFQEQLISAPYLVLSQRQRGERSPVFTGSTLFFEVLLILLTVLALLAYGLGRQLTGVASPLDRTLILLAAVLPGVLMRDYLRHLSFASFNFQSLFVLDSLACVLQLGGLAALCWQGYLSAGAALLAMGAANGLAVAIWFVGQSEPWQVVPAQLWSDWQELWSFGKWALASFLINCSAPLVMPWVMAVAINTESAGVLAACTSLTGLANTLVMGVCNYLSPKAARAYTEEGLPGLNKILRESALFFLGTVGSLTLLFGVAGEFVAVTVYGPAYQGSGLILFVLMCGILCNSLGIVLGNGLWAVHRPEANFRADVVSLLTALLSTAALVPLWGVLGAACASALAPIGGTIVRWGAYRSVSAELQRNTAEPAADAADQQLGEKS